MIGLLEPYCKKQGADAHERIRCQVFIITTSSQQNSGTCMKHAPLSRRKNMNRHSSENTPHHKPEKDDHFLKNEEHFLEKENNSWHFQQKSTKKE